MVPAIVAGLLLISTLLASLQIGDLGGLKMDADFSEKEIARRRDETARRMLNTPYTPQQPLKPSKRRRGCAAVTTGSSCAGRGCQKCVRTTSISTSSRSDTRRGRCMRPWKKCGCSPWAPLVARRSSVRPPSETTFDASTYW